MTQLLMYALIAVLGVCCFLLITQRKARDAALSQVSKFVNWFYGMDKCAVLQREIDKEAAKVATFRQAVAKNFASREGYRRAVERDTAEVATLTQRIKDDIESGNNTAAEDNSVKLHDAELRLGKDQAKYTEYDTAYNNNLEKAQYSQTMIQEKRRKALELGTALDMAVVDAENAKLMEAMSGTGPHMDTINELEESIQRDIDVHRGVAQVALDMSSQGLAEIEQQKKEKRQAGKAVLDRIKAEMAQKA